MGEGSAFEQFAPALDPVKTERVQILSQRSDVPFHRGTEKLMKERKTKHDRLKKTNLIVSFVFHPRRRTAFTTQSVGFGPQLLDVRGSSAGGGDRTRTSFSEPRILSPTRTSKTGRNRKILGLFYVHQVGWRLMEVDEC